MSFSTHLVACHVRTESWAFEQQEGCQPIPGRTGGCCDNHLSTCIPLSCHLSLYMYTYLYGEIPPSVLPREAKKERRSLRSGVSLFDISIDACMQWLEGREVLRPSAMSKKRQRQRQQQQQEEEEKASVQLPMTTSKLTSIPLCHSVHFDLLIPFFPSLVSISSLHLHHYRPSSIWRRKRCLLPQLALLNWLVEKKSRFCFFRFHGWYRCE